MVTLMHFNFNHILDRKLTDDIRVDEQVCVS